MIVFSDQIVDEGQAAFEVRTERAIYCYHQSGCGFSSLIDRDGKDWIGYRRKGGARGHYRGIPNMGHESFGHPGYETGRTELLLRSSDLVKFSSSSVDGAWEVEWEIHPTHAVMTGLGLASPAWLLYEGTPGGKFNPASQELLLSDGTRARCAERRVLAAPGPEWVAFCDPKSNRSLALAYAGPDGFPCTYWPMGGKGGMTVFGFGRTDAEGLDFWVKQTPFRFSFALVESTSFEEIAAYVRQYLPARA